MLRAALARSRPSLRIRPRCHTFSTISPTEPLKRSGPAVDAPIELPSPPADAAQPSAASAEPLETSRQTSGPSTSSDSLDFSATPQPRSSPSLQREAQAPLEDAGSLRSLGPSSSKEVNERLRMWWEDMEGTLRMQADTLKGTAVTRFSQLGAQLNHVTGYHEIEELKKRVVEQESRINDARQTAREAKRMHEDAVAQRAASQREVNDLLSRKSTWSDEDVGRFTRLVRQDHIYEQAETRATAAVTGAEDAVEREFSELMRSILARYHEEQVWSDKIRSASTYGSLAVLGLNVLVFVIATVAIEPWKRRRLAQTFERKVEEMDARNTEMIGGGMATLKQHLEEHDKALAQIAGTVTALEYPPSPDPPAASPPPLLGETTPSTFPAVDVPPWYEDTRIIVPAGAAFVAYWAGWAARTWLRSS